MTDRSVLLVRLADAEAALHTLLTGKSVSVISYGNAGSTKSVTYTRASVATLRGYIADLKAQLGLARRRPLRVMF